MSRAHLEELLDDTHEGLRDLLEAVVDLHIMSTSDAHVAGIQTLSVLRAAQINIEAARKELRGLPALEKGAA